MTRAVVVVLCLALIGCQPSDSLAVQLVSDLDPGREIDTAHVTIRAASATILDTTVTIDAGRRLGRPSRLAQTGSLAAGTYTVHVALEHAGHVVIERDARPTVSGPSVVTLLMLRDCTGVMCPGSASATDVACLGGRCVPPECDEEHPELCPHAECTTASDCPSSGVACVETTCTSSGVCFARPADERCATGLVCSSIAGCISPDADAGMFDAGSDAGADAGTDAGASLLAPTILVPWVGMPTGSSLAPVGAVTPHPLAPIVRWTSVPGAGSYHVWVDDSCTNGVQYCAFPSPEVEMVTTATEITTPPLAVTDLPPHARRYWVAVAACEDAAGTVGCAYSRTRYMDVGRTAGDFDGDAYADLVIAAPGSAVGDYDAHVYGGATRSMLGGGWTGPGRPELAAIGDVDGDLQENFAIGLGAPTQSVTVIGGATAGRMYQDEGGVAGDAGHVGFVGDLDGDGYADLAIGAPQNGPGVVFVHYGSPTGPAMAVDYRLRSNTGATRFGSAVAGADLDSDGYSDVVVAGDLGGHPVLEVFLSHNFDRGFSPAMVYEETTATSANDFVRLAGGGDVDGDGRPDVIAVFLHEGIVRLLSYDGSVSRVITMSAFGPDAITSLAMGGTPGAPWQAIAGAPHRAPLGAVDSGGGLVVGGVRPPDVQFVSVIECCGAGSQTGTAVSFADLDAQGIPERILSIPPMGGLYVIDGEDGTTSTWSPAVVAGWGAALSH